MSASDRLKIFDKLYKDNKDLIKMPKLRNYPINYKIGLNWADSHCDKESASFARNIIKHTAYVSFVEFMHQLELVCKSFKHHYEKKSSKFILVVPLKLNKSNFWVTLLAYPFIKSMIHDIYDNITDVYNDYVIEKSDNPVVCIICDDCAYTGSQLLSYCTLDPIKLKYKDKPTAPDETSIDWINWVNVITEHTSAMEKTIDKKVFSVNLILPYVSTIAQNTISERHFILIPHNAKIFKVFREHVNVHEYNQGVMREFEMSFQYHSNISAIYFDHKVADAVSTFNKIYLLAPIFNCGSLRKSICFIEGCCEKQELPDSVNIYDIYINVEDYLDGKVCLPTFYKSIRFTLNNNIIKNPESLTIRDLLKLK